MSATLIDRRPSPGAARRRRRVLRGLVPPVVGIGLAMAMTVAGSRSLLAPAPASPSPQISITDARLTDHGKTAILSPGSVLDLELTVSNRYTFPVRLDALTLSPLASSHCRTQLVLKPGATANVELPARRTTGVRLTGVVLVTGPGCDSPPDEPQVTITVGAT
jgi:hypothetical protein